MGHTGLFQAVAKYRRRGGHGKGLTDAYKGCGSLVRLRDVCGVRLGQLTTVQSGESEVFVEPRGIRASRYPIVSVCRAPVSTVQPDQYPR